MKAKDMREKSREDLLDLEKSLANDAFQSKLKNFTNRLDDTSQIRKLRRDVARVKTILGELAHKGSVGAPVKAKAAPAVAKVAAASAAAKAPAKKKAPASKPAKAAKSEAKK
jgi:large subunit ribosomal protein L29